MNLPGIPGIYTNPLGSSVPSASASKVSLQQGQIVQATVLKLLPGQLATVALGGLIMTALLETPLKVGQKAWLQVESESDLPKLKIIEQPAISTSLQSSTLPDSTLKGLLDALGIVLTKDQQEIAQHLTEENTPITKGLLKSLPSIFDELGATRDTLEAMSLANQKGLPLTPESVQSLKVFMSNQSMEKQVDQLLQHLDQIELDQQTETSHSNANSAVERTDKAVSNGFINQLIQLKQQLTGMKQTISSLHQYIRGHVQDTENPHIPSAPLKSMSVPSSNSQVQTAPQPSQTSQKNQTNVEFRMDQLIQAVKGWMAPDSDKQVPAGTYSIEPQAVLQDQNNPVNSQPPEQPLENPISFETSSRNASIEEPKDLINHFFQSLGIDYESQLVQADSSQPLHEQTDVQSLKAALLQILQHPDASSLPETIKQDLQQMVHHITGQQLLVSSDTNSLFAQFSLQIPIPGSRSDQNAMVHVEARKKGNGKIDSENCRLFFCLSMQHIGETMIDVAIVNKILSVTFYNDQPWIAQVMKDTQGTLRGALSNQGYYLSQIRILPVPSKPDQFIKAPPKSLAEYKGVDLKI